MATPLHIKGSRTRVLNTLPSSNLGNDGDIVISRIKNKGVYLCTKAGGIWYAANQLQELRKIDKASIGNLKANKLNISSLTDASKDTDTFIVSDKGQIGYRTGDELVDDLDIPFTDIDYKQAYCSLGQYTNKEDCEANNGTWYYSDNDSHDSISSTAENELLTIASSLGKLDAEPTLLYDGSTLEIKHNSYFDDNWQTSAQTNLLKLSYDGSISGVVSANMSLAEGGNFTIDASRDITLEAEVNITLNADGGQVYIKDDTASHFRFDCDHTTFTMYDDTDEADSFAIAVGASGATIIATVDDGAAVGHLTLRPDGNLVLDPVSQKTIINATDVLYFDGGNHTCITESSDDILRFVVGEDSDVMIQLSEKGDDGNEISFGSSCVGFTQLEPTYNAVATTVDFRHSNKQNLTFCAGSITNVQLYFPLVSGNFQLLIKQDGTGSRTITNYKVYEFDESLADGDAAVKWAGGSNPTLTTDANHVDILSFYWDADNEIAYGVATLDFQF